MPELTITKQTRWECQRCGSCCRGFIVSKKKSLSKISNGKVVCKYLDEKTNLCKNYENRPFICRIYPFIIDINSIVENGTARPQNAFKLENLMIHTECPGYGKGKRIYGNKNLQKKLSSLAYEFALKFKECFEQGRDISEIM